MLSLNFFTVTLELPDSRFLRKIVGRALGPGYEAPTAPSCCPTGKAAHVSCTAATDEAEVEHAMFTAGAGITTGFISVLSSEIRVTTFAPRKKSCTKQNST